MLLLLREKIKAFLQIFKIFDGRVLVDEFLMKLFLFQFLKLSAKVSAFHNAAICVETAPEQPPHWPIVSPKYLKVDLTRNLSFAMLTFHRDVIVAGMISPEYLQHT